MDLEGVPLGEDMAIALENAAVTCPLAGWLFKMFVPPPAWIIAAAI
jgi:hypothetical protein